MQWMGELFMTEILPGAIGTIQVSVIALIATGVMATLVFPLISPLFFGRITRLLGNAALIILRSTPEYVLAFIFMLLWGPSMLPVIVALVLHNGAIIGHIVGRYSENVDLRIDSSTGFNRYIYEVLPRVYRQLLSLLFYRWEIIARESAVLGMLGVYTLGFYIDSGFADLRFDRVIILLLFMSLFIVIIDAISRVVRRSLRLSTKLVSEHNQ